MNCELVYAIRPKARVKFSQVIWEKILPAALNSHWVKSRPDVLKMKALMAMTQKTMGNTEFRRRQKWTERQSE